MKFLTILKVGLKAIARNKMRSALTALGIIIGVACVIAMIGVGKGSQAAIQSQISALGTNFLMVFPGVATQSGARIFTGESTLTEDDVAAVKAECPSVAYVSPMSRSAGQVVAGNLNWGTQVQGVGVEWPFIRSWNTSSGSFFGESEVRSAAKVCLLGSTVANALFGDQDPVGDSVRIKNFPFRVVGVLETKGGNTQGQDQDDTVVAPYTTVMRLLKGLGIGLAWIVGIVAVMQLVPYGRTHANPPIIKEPSVEGRRIAGDVWSEASVGVPGPPPLSQ